MENAGDGLNIFLKIGRTGVANMVKWLKSIVYIIKLKLYFKLITVEMLIKLRKGEILPHNYIWIRLSQIIGKEKNNGT